MEYEIKRMRGADGRLFSFRVKDDSRPIGSFKDTPDGTEYICGKSPKGLFLLPELKSENKSHTQKLLKFVCLIDSQKIPNVPFRLTFIEHNLTDDGWAEFLLLLFPKRKSKKAVTRRYYLHTKVNPWCNLYPTESIIGVRDFEMVDIPPNIQKFIMELKNKYRYSIQIEIQPAAKDEGERSETPLAN